MGWIEWRRELVGAPAIENTGRIISEIKADVLCLVEVESRPVLKRFNETILKAAPYPHAMLIDGNDDRGIDVALGLAADRNAFKTAGSGQPGWRRDHRCAQKGRRKVGPYCGRGPGDGYKSS